MLFYKFIDGIDVCFYGSGNDIGIGAKAVVDVSVIFYLHVYFPDVVAAFADGLDGEFPQYHLAVYDIFQCFDGCIDRTIAGCRCFKLLACYVQAEAGNGADAHAAGHLQIFQFDVP